jgi:membrane protease YdiL (CAAX protease family)
MKMKRGFIMKKNYIRITIITAFNFFFTFLMFGPLGWDKYMASENLYIWATICIIGSAIPMLVTLLFFKLADKKPISSMGFRFSAKDALFSASFFVFFIFFSLGLVWLISETTLFSAHWNLAVLSEPSFYLQLVFVLLAWFFAGFYEEILFRGYFVSNLRSLNKWKVYVIISVIFMLSHAFKGLDPFYALVLIIMSVAFIYAYLRTGSLMPLAVAHMTYNFVVSHLIGTSDISIIVVSNENQLIPILSLIVLFLVSFLFFINLFYRKEEDFIQIPDREIETI